MTPFHGWCACHASMGQLLDAHSGSSLNAEDAGGRKQTKKPQCRSHFILSDLGTEQLSPWEVLVQVPSTSLVNHSLSNLPLVSFVTWGFALSLVLAEQCIRYQHLSGSTRNHFTAENRQFLLLCEWFPGARSPLLLLWCLITDKIIFQSFPLFGATHTGFLLSPVIPLKTCRNVIPWLKVHKLCDIGLQTCSILPSLHINCKSLLWTHAFEGTSCLIMLRLQNTLYLCTESHVSSQQKAYSSSLLCGLRSPGGGGGHSSWDSLWQ